MTAVRVGTGVFGLVVVLLVAASVALQFGSTVEQHVLRYPTVTRLDLLVDDGDVTVEIGNGPGVEIAETVHRGIFAPTRSALLTGGTLHLQAACSTWLPGSCEVDYRVRVPAGTPVSVRTSDGTVVAGGPLGPVALRTDDGDVVLRELTTPTLDVHSGDGDLDLDLASRPSRSTITTGDGDVHLLLPPGAYAVSATSGDGSTRIAVATVPTSDAVVAIRTGDGDIEIRYRDG